MLLDLSGYMLPVGLPATLFASMLYMLMVFQSKLKLALYNLGAVSHIEVTGYQSLVIILSDYGRLMFVLMKQGK